MGKDRFDKLNGALKEKLLNCKDEAEMRKVVSESGIELNDDMLEAVSGGQSKACPSAKGGRL